MSKPPHVIFTKRADAEAYKALRDRALGYPSRAVDIHGNPVGDATEGGLGWTTTHQEIVEHPNGNKCACATIDIDTDPRALQNKDKLSSAEKAEMRAKHADREDLDETWEDDQGEDEQ